MEMLTRKVKDSYNFIFYELVDDRTKDVFPSGLAMMIILPSYLYFSKILGPGLMRERKPFNLRTPIFYYNLFQIYMSAHLFYLGIKGGWFNGYNFLCQPVDMTENVQSRTMLNAAWWYLVIKLVDLMDTVFFVLRKKDRQVSFLHVFHHFMMPIAAFICLKYYPNGHATFVGLINTVVHFVMYIYYLISGLGPAYQKYVWWKKYLTAMQLVQFSMVFTHNFIGLINSTCNYPKWICFLLCIHAIQFLYLFGKFYYNSYIMKSEPKSNGIAEKNVDKDSSIKSKLL